MSSIVRPITELRPESRQIPALEELSIEKLLDFLQGIKDPDFHKERGRLEEPAKAILDRKLHEQGRADFKEMHWWARKDVLAAVIIGTIATVLTIILALRR